MSPNHSLDVHLAVGDAVCLCLCDVCLTVDVGSLQPNHPGSSHDVLGELAVGVLEVVVIVGAGAAVCEDNDVVLVVVVGSLHPNQPGVLQVEVDVEVE